MKFYRGFHLTAKIYGIIITLLMLLIFGTTLIVSIIENGSVEIVKMIIALINWQDDPTGFFFTYIIGYAIIWWRPLWGSIIIILGSMMISIINIDNSGFLIFAIPTLLVGLFYIISWHLLRDKRTYIAGN